MAALCVLLLVACGYDYRTRKIPNKLIAAVALCGVIWRFCEDGWIGILLYLGEMLCVTLLMYPLFKIGTVGAGDVKLSGVSAGFLPFQKIFLFLFVSLLVAALISIVKRDFYSDILLGILHTPEELNIRANKIRLNKDFLIQHIKFPVIRSK